MPRLHSDYCTADMQLIRCAMKWVELDFGHGLIFPKPPLLVCFRPTDSISNLNFKAYGAYVKFFNNVNVATELRTPVPVSAW